jgi:eukaryotic-like serine/threonine-protein kinase
VYSFRDFTVDPGRACLWRAGEEVKLRPKVFEALSYLVVNNNRLVTKDELIKAIWKDTFVTDDSLVQCLVELRRALGDEAQACIKTVPRRGYIFTAEVTEVRPSAPVSPATPAPTPKRSRRTAIALAAVAVATVAVSYLTWVRPPARPGAFKEKDSVLVADFVNTTGDEVFDGTLRQAVAVQLGQSPYLDVFSEERVRETLRYMGRSPSERVTPDVAREIAQRRGVKALLAGSISSLGRHYVIGLEAVNAATGETIVPSNRPRLLRWRRSRPTTWAGRSTSADSTSRRSPSTGAPSSSIPTSPSRTLRWASPTAPPRSTTWPRSSRGGPSSFVRG